MQIFCLFNCDIAAFSLVLHITTPFADGVWMSYKKKTVLILLSV
jgi:hypothetical protein